MTESVEANRIDKLLDHLVQKGKNDQIESELERIKLDTLNSAEREAWYHSYGIQAFQRGDHLLAKQRFQEGLVHFPDSISLKFSLGQELIFLNESKRAFELFDQCTVKELSPSYFLWMSRYAYLHNEFQRGLNYLDPLLEAYLSYKVLDMTFLSIRGIPHFRQSILTYALFCILTAQKKHLSDVFKELRATCSDFDFETCLYEIKAYCSGDYSLYLNANTKNHRGYVFDGYFQVQEACFMAKNADSYEGAMSALEQIKTHSLEFPWLVDIVIASKAQAALRFEKPKEELSFRARFLKNQPWFFEPEHVIAFGLIEYQEELKKFVHPFINPCIE